MPFRTNGRVYFQPVFLTRHEVVGAVSRCGVNDASASFERDICTQNAERVSIEERVTEADVFQLLALHAGDDLREVATGRCRNSRSKRFSDDHRVTVDVIRGIVELRVERDGKVRRNRPWRRRPDQHRDVATSSAREHATRARPRFQERAETRRRSTARCGLHTQLRPRLGRYGSECTSEPASCLCRPAPFRRIGRRSSQWPPGTDNPS